MERKKIAERYFRKGYGRSKPRKCNVYLIDGFAYAKDSETANTSMDKLNGDLSGYVRVNFFPKISNGTFFEVHASEHLPKQNTEKH